MITPKNVLTQFGKAIATAYAVSFSISARQHCDDGCAVKNNGCYAQAIERLYPTLFSKLRRHQMNMVKTANMALAACQALTAKGKAIDWFRFSVDGGLPIPSTTKRWSSFKPAFRRLCEWLVNNVGSNRIHLPVESRQKATIYRRLVGDIITVRRTCQSVGAALRSKDTRAVRVGKSNRACHLKHNIGMAYELVSKLRQRGESAVVCPAVASDSKCGKCTACANPAVNVVVYPLHP